MILPYRFPVIIKKLYPEDKILRIQLRLYKVSAVKCKDKIILQSQSVPAWNNSF